MTSVIEKGAIPAQHSRTTESRDCDVILEMGKGKWTKWNGKSSSFTPTFPLLKFLFLLYYKSYLNAWKQVGADGSSIGNDDRERGVGEQMQLWNCNIIPQSNLTMLLFWRSFQNTYPPTWSCNACFKSLKNRLIFTLVNVPMLAMYGRKISMIRSLIITMWATTYHSKWYVTAVRELQRNMSFLKK